MTTVGDLRVALRSAVEDPPPMSDDLLAAIEDGRHRPSRPDRPHRGRRGFIAGIVVAGAAATAIAAFSLRKPDTERTGFERYNPAAIEELKGHSPVTLPRSTHAVVVTMETRYVCQSIYAYLDDPDGNAAAVLRRRVRSADRATDGDLTGFTNFVRQSLAKATGGSAPALAELARTECPDRGQLTAPIRRGGP